MGFHRDLSYLDKQKLMLKKRTCKIILFFISIFYAVNSTALEALPEVPRELPSTSDVSFVQQRLETPVPLTKKTGGITTTAHKPSEKNAALEKIHLKLTKIIFKGNTVFSDAELNEIFNPKYNKTISLADLQELVDAITIKYRDKGYILSRAILPPQSIKNGIVTVQIIEGFISDVKISGNPGRTKRMIEQYGQHIEKSRPFKMQVLERDILLMNDIPGLTVHSVITPSKNIPGGADLTLIVERMHASGYINYNNYGTRYIGPQQTAVSGTIYSYGAPGDSNTVNYTTTARTTELQYYEFNHTQPFGINGLRWTLDGNYTETRPQFILQPLQIVGRSTP